MGEEHPDTLKAMNNLARMTGKKEPSMTVRMFVFGRNSGA
jgi:hypothetical protein